MGYDLTNAAGGYVRFTGSGWDLVLAVARHYGWKPAGTPKPQDWDDETDDEWGEGYWANAGQEVSADDAAAMADALERAARSPDFIETVARLLTETRDRVDAHLGSSLATNPDARTQAAGFRPRAIELAAFARQGSFVIE